jgi:hypothetical protein
MDGKCLCLICSESMSVRKEYNLAGQFEEQTPINALRREKLAALQGEWSHNRMCSESNPVTVPLYCGQ